MKTLMALITLCLLSACAFAQDRAEETYTLHGDAACDTVLALASDSALTYAVAYPSGRLLDADTLEDAGTVESVLPTGRTDYTLTVSHEGATWSYDLHVECPPPTEEPSSEPEAHSLGEALRQGGIDPLSGAVVTAVPVRKLTPAP